MGYSPWDGKESDTTEVTEHARVHTHTHSSSNPAFSESLPHSSHSHPNSVTHPSSVFPHNSDRVLYQSDFHTTWQLSVSAKGTISYSRTGTPSFLFISQCPTLEGMATHSVFLPGLVDNSPGGHRELHMIERLTLSLSTNTRGFPGGASGKEPSFQCRGYKRHMFDPWIGKIPWRRAWQSTPVFLPGDQGQRSLAGYSPWGHKGSDCD